MPWRPLRLPRPHWATLVFFVGLAAFLAWRARAGALALATVGAEDYAMLGLSSDPEALAHLWLDPRQNVYRPFLYSFYALLWIGRRTLDEPWLWTQMTALLGAQLAAAFFLFRRLLRSPAVALAALALWVWGFSSFRLSQFWMGFAVISTCYGLAVLVAAWAGRGEGKPGPWLGAWGASVFGTTVGAWPVLCLAGGALRGWKVRLLAAVGATPLLAALLWKVLFYAPGTVWYELLFHQYTGVIDLSFRPDFALGYVGLIAGAVGAGGLKAWPALALAALAQAALLIWACTLGQPDERRALLRRALLGLAGLVLAFAFLPTWQERYALFFAPLWALVLALALDLLGTRSPRALAGAILIGALLLGAGIARSWPTGWAERTGMPLRIRATARAVQEIAFRETLRRPVEPLCLPAVVDDDPALFTTPNFPRATYLSDAARSGTLLAYRSRGVPARALLATPCVFSLSLRSRDEGKL